MNEFLTKKEMASILRISLNTLNFWIYRRQIPFIKLGTGKNAPVRFSIEEVEEWLKNLKEKNLSNREQIRD